MFSLIVLNVQGKSLIVWSPGQISNIHLIFAENVRIIGNIRTRAV